MVGRRLAGAGQLLLAVAGFCMVIGFLGLRVFNAYNKALNDAEPMRIGWLGAAGGLTFLAAWLWALVTSMQVLRAADRQPPQLPPRLENPAS